MTLRPRTEPGAPRTGRERKAEDLLLQLARKAQHTGAPDCLCSDCVTAALAAEIEREEQVRPMKRVNWLPAPHFFNLNQACRVINDSFEEGYGCYLVGSCTRTRDYRDVDVRMILSDREFEKLFPNSIGRPDLNPLWSLMCSSISLFLQTHSGLPVDFQIQAQITANAEFPRANGHDRQPLGIFLRPTPRDYAASVADADKAPP